VLFVVLVANHYGKLIVIAVSLTEEVNCLSNYISKYFKLKFRLSYTPSNLIVLRLPHLMRATFIDCFILDDASPGCDPCDVNSDN